METPPPSVSTGQEQGWRHRRRRLAEALQLTSVGLLTNVALAAIKLTAGLLGHSYALIADGIESSTDAVTSLIVWGGFRISLLPPDANHPFGHGKVESLSAFVVALGLIAASLVIAVNGVAHILHPGPMPHWFTLPILAAIIALKEYLARRVLSAGTALESQSLQGDAWHHRSDALSSIAAFVGISLTLIGGERFHAADGCAALVAAVIIAVNGFLLVGPAMNEMLDAAPAKSVSEQVRTVAASVAGVREIEKCRIRKSGLDLYVQIHVVVDGNKTVREGHAIAHRVKDALMQSGLSVADVEVHIEPTGGLFE